MSDKLDRVEYLPVELIKRNDEYIEYLDFFNAGYMDKFKYLVLQESYLVPGQYAGRPEVLCHYFYGNKKYWWIVCTANGIVDPLTELVAGMVLAMPTRASMDTLLGQSGNTLSKTNYYVGATIEI